MLNQITQWEFSFAKVKNLDEQPIRELGSAEGQNGFPTLSVTTCNLVTVCMVFIQIITKSYIIVLEGK